MLKLPTKMAARVGLVAAFVILAGSVVGGIALAADHGRTPSGPDTSNVSDDRSASPDGRDDGQGKDDQGKDEQGTASQSPRPHGTCAEDADDRGSDGSGQESGDDHAGATPMPSASRGSGDRDGADDCGTEGDRDGDGERGGTPRPSEDDSHHGTATPRPTRSDS